MDNLILLSKVDYSCGWDDFQKEHTGAVFLIMLCVRCGNPPVMCLKCNSA